MYKPELSYVNHLGEELNLSEHVYLQDDNNFLSGELSRISINDKTAGFYHASSEKKFTLYIVANTKEEGYELRDKIYEVSEVDSEETKAGRLYLDGWYLTGYFKSLTFSEYMYLDVFCKVDITFVCDSPKWTKEHVFEISGALARAGLNYPHNYQYNYGGEYGVSRIYNPAVSPTEFKLICQGACSNPSVRIGDNTYRVNVSLLAGELLIINSLDNGTRKTIVKYDNEGNQTNVFQYRYGEQRKGCGTYVFEPIKQGDNVVSWNGQFGIVLTLYEQRMYRRWS